MRFIFSPPYPTTLHPIWRVLPRQGYLSALLAASGLLVGVLSILLANRHVSLGVWGQSEPVLVAVHAGAALGLAAFGIGAARDSRIAAMIRSPVILVALALTTWILLTAPLMEFPWASVLGAPQSGEGALWPLDLVGYVLAGRLLLRGSPKLFSALAGLSAVLTVVVGLCNLPTVRLEWGPWPIGVFFGFPMFLAYSALPLLPLAWALREQGKGLWIGGTLAGVAGILLSDNRTALAALGIYAGVLAVRYFAPRWSSPPPLAVVAMVAAVLLIPYGLIRHTDWLHGVVSLSTRATLLAVVDSHIFDTVQSALVGHGWGHYQDYLVRNIADVGVSLYDNSWGDLWKDIFHSHNAAIEAAFSAGLPGAALAVMLRAAVVLEAPPQARGIALAFVLAWTLLDSTWFMLGCSLAPLALALAVLANAETPPALPRWLAAITGGIAALGLSVAAVVLLNTALNFEDLKACLPPQPWAETCTAQEIPDDPRGSNLGLAYLINDAMLTVPLGHGPRDAMPLNQAKLLAKTRQEATRRTKTASLSLSLAILNAFAQVTLAAPKQRFGDRFEAAWREQILTVLHRAPHRMDVAASYFDRMLRNDDEARAETLLQAMEKIDPTHPVVLWQRGIRLLADPAPARQAEGLAALRRALEGGVERLMVIAPEWAAQLRSAPTPHKP